MGEFLKNIKGDRGVWGALLVLAAFSFLPMYSASSNLVNVIGSGSTNGYLVKHILILILGFIFLFYTHKIPYRYFSGLSILLLILAFVLLVYTLSKGTTIAGATAARWIEIPFIGISFQTSTFAGLALMMYVARYFSRRTDKEFDFKDSFWFLWIPVALILLPILPSNLSTTLLIFFCVVLICVLVGYPIKFLLRIFLMALVLFTLFVFIGRSFSNAIKVKTETWKNRLVKTDSDASYQKEKAKMAIATGGVIGRGAGKSVQKNFLPQSSSDFIFAIIVEEWGLVGGIGTILIYMWLLFRIWVVAKRAKTVFATLLTIGVGFPIVIQSIVNMAVASNMLPVTGQTLPLLSSGGTSIWMTFIAIGIVLSVSAAESDTDKNETLIDENPLDVLYEAVD
jgi:cell division protein FtsW